MDPPPPPEIKKGFANDIMFEVCKGFADDSRFTKTMKELFIKAMDTKFQKDFLHDDHVDGKFFNIQII